MERLTIKKEDGSYTFDQAASQLPLIMQKLGEMEDAEEQGLLLRLPCKIGDVVYCTWTTLDKNGKLKREVVEENFKLEMLMDVGYAVFITREEAEQALAKMKEV